MQKKYRIFLLMIWIVSISLITACTNQEYKKTVNRETVLEDISRITAEGLFVEEKDDGLHYTFRVLNGSPYKIKYNVVYFSYPIITHDGSKDNEFKIEAKGNKLDILPNEKVFMNVFVPKEMYQDNELLIIDQPRLEMKGFINSVDYENMFHTSL